jgi:hypothetical protein
VTTTQVELFRSDDYVPHGRQALVPLLRTFFEPLVGQPLERARFLLYFLPVADERLQPGTPSMVNLRASHGWLQVRIERDGRLLYRHPHSVREVLAGQLQRQVAAEYPDEQHWGYCVRAPGLDTITLVRPAPQSANQVDLRVGGPRRPRRFHVEEIPEPDPPVASLADLGVDPDEPDPGAPVGVVVDLATYDTLTRHLPFSTEVEEGGFLVGRTYRSSSNPDGYLVKLSSVVPAERTGASLMHFTFTGASFLRMGDVLDAMGDGQQLVGWYHTHLFAATEQLGLSSIDVELHTSTFRRPAQVAGLLNLDGSSRVLRFYRSTGSAMDTAPYWVVRS